jgi:hypothetical protein
MQRLMVAAVLAALVVSSSAFAAGTPPQLYNKTIVVSWTSTGTLLRPDGSERTFHNSNVRTVYISSAGRLFARVNLNSADYRGVGRSENFAPGQSRNDQGGVSEVHFEGNRLVGRTTFTSGGARQYTATFDASFSSCTASVITGTAAGAGSITTRGPDGSVVKVTNMTAEGASCAIQDGNAFAGH